MPKRSPSNIFPTACKRVVFLCLIVLSVGNLWAQELKQFEIEMQPLASALKEFGLQADIQISGASELTTGKMSQAVLGEMNVPQAIRLLLEGTGLEHEFVSEHTVFLRLPANAEDPKITAILAEAVLKGGVVDRTVVETSSSVAFYDDTMIADLAGVDELTTLLDATPNVNFVGGDTGYSIRGFGAAGPLGGDASIISGDNPRSTVYRDGRPFSFVETVFGYAPLWDVAQVEVYRGAESSTRLANSIVGAIHIHSKEPVHYNEGKARGIYASEDTLQFSVMGNVSVIEEELALRFAVDYRDHGSFLTFRPAGGSFVGDVGEDRTRTETTHARVITLYEPKAIDGLKSKFTYMRDEFSGPQAELSFGPDFLDYVTDNNRFSVFAGESDAIITNLTWRHDSGLALSNHFTFTDLFYQRLEAPGDQATANTSEDWANEFVVEFDDTEGPFSGLIGSYFRKTKDDSFFPQVNPFAFEFSFGGEKESIGLFGELNYVLTDSLSLTGGLRYQRDKSIRVSRRTFFPSSLFLSRIDEDLNYEETFDAWLPRFAFSYEFKDNSLIGFAVSKGSNPGAASADVFVFPLFVYEYDEETAWNYELFAKTDWLESKLTADLNLFYSEYTNAQVRRHRLVADVPEVSLDFDVRTTLLDIVNVDQLISYGAEGHLNFEVSSALSAYLSLGFVETEISSSRNLQGVKDGGELLTAPNFTGTLGVNYVPLPGLVISTQAKYTSEAFSDIANQSEFVVGGRDVIVDAQIAYDWERYRVFGFVTNVFDNYYELRRTQNSAFQGTPREFGIGFEARF